MENKITTPTVKERRIIKFMILLGIFSILNFIYFFFQPENIGDPFLFTLLTITLVYSITKKLYMWYNYSNISVPESPGKTPNLKVDILTTYFPGEPYQMTITTLEAINHITYPHTTYLCDEANDPYLKQFCEENGIIHVTRDNRINAKAGNINNALEKYAEGDICVILDPDHIPEPIFLDPILPYFNDPEIAFVQIVQSYYNIKETLVARGAAEQTFQFYGPMMMTLNAYGAVNAIGANCVFRRAALDSIGGHAPGLCEDMHTAMLLYSKGWKAVYVPEVLARGLAPSNLTNFFKQQLKWSRGTFDLLVKVYPKIFNKLTGRQKIHYGILPLHYLGGVICLINFLIPVISLLFAITPWDGNIIDFALVILPVALSSLLIRTFIQKWVIEKKERGFHLVGGLLFINTWWIYIIGLLYTIIDKKVPYLPTPKENEWNTNYRIVIPNLIVAIVSLFAIFYGLSIDFTPYSIVMAGFAFFNACIMFFGIYLSNKVTNQNRILRTSLTKSKISFLWKAKEGIGEFASSAFSITRKIALPLLLLTLITSMNLKNLNDLYRWEMVEAPYERKKFPRVSGHFPPSGN
ncbi:glycosyltransferase [Antarcticibacterium sp. 1MA-6-2]|uniref:glycosyltransferase n=1 Tax=Antarcticibacterium sp. 1MA-6-2 TaxID=2908210 RepID=UPI001F2E05DF|nr:cellulose synthase catalytic subunit [Antarcticibacterium sp. 1MA-6-2]UJH89723.1 glycosyltransferase [Antarcticibacterium sp. 1MA-6-2]